MRSFWIVCLVTVAVHATEDYFTTLEVGSTPISVHPTTLRLVDETFREVYFHGLNVVVKGFPWIPDTSEAYWSPTTSFNSKDMNALRDLGLNAIRLGTMWPGVEPNRGDYNDSYLDALHTLVQNASTFGIYSLMDMHQDVLSEKFCGEGVPLWAAIPANNSLFPSPNGPAYTVNDEGIPLNSECLSKPWSEYYFTKAAGTAFQNLYDNQFGLRDSWAAFWKKVATSMSDLGNSVLGYELMNEPWAGDAVGDLLLMVPGVADRVNLQPMWDIGASAIRSVDASHAIFFEGVTWDWVGVGFTEVPGGAAWRNKSVLSYHFYVPPDFSIDVQFTARMDDMRRLQCGGFLTEAWVYDTSCMDACDAMSQSWLLWEYKPFAHAKTGYSDSIWFENGTMNVAMASSLSRTYAKIVAGRTVTQRYDNVTYLYLLVFTGDALVTRNTTRIYLNEALHYGNGYSVQVTSSLGSEYVSWERVGVNHIDVQHDLIRIGSNDTVTVVITAE
mmetsp:Transcript_41352/g.48021  ORF Transcript_41352/g.48021 Transcript_41352/m.48021 type:complete len:499 (-) Transcript_41352:134-1630(-)